MLARPLTLASAALALLIAPGCYRTEDRPTGTSAAGVPDASDKLHLPVAPPPRTMPDGKPKTTAELLIGTWRQVETGDDRRLAAIPDEEDIRLIFRPDGTFGVQVTSRKNGFQSRAGTYTFIDTTVRLTFLPDADGPSTTSEFRVTALSERELRTASKTDVNPDRHVYKRIDSESKPHGLQIRIFL